MYRRQQALDLLDHRHAFQIAYTQKHTHSPSEQQAHSHEFSFFVAQSTPPCGASLNEYEINANSANSASTRKHGNTMQRAGDWYHPRAPGEELCRSKIFVHRDLTWTTGLVSQCTVSENAHLKHKIRVARASAHTPHAEGLKGGWSGDGRGTKARTPNQCRVRASLGAMQLFSNAWKLPPPLQPIVTIEHNNAHAAC